jgi:hypothetical protein
MVRTYGTHVSAALMQRVETRCYKTLQADGLLKDNDLLKIRIRPGA